MFPLRTLPIYRKVQNLFEAGELGGLRRVMLISTAWFRSQEYYNTGGWRATWAGEGGGVLLNQCPHTLDLWQWIVGDIPIRMRAFCAFGKYHDIEVEDDVSAYFEYANGATGVFAASTGELPGSNRFEIIGDRGKIVIENPEEPAITFHRTGVPVSRFTQEHKTGFGEPESRLFSIPLHGTAGLHREITQNWIEAILQGTPLLAPGEDGLRSLEISNAMLLSTWLDDWVTLPVDDDLFYAKLQERIQRSSKCQRFSSG